MKTVLSGLDSRWCEAASRRVCENLNRIVEHDLAAPVTEILVWMPFFAGEVDLTSFIGTQTGRRRIYLPRVHDDGTMTFIRIQENWAESLSAGLHGVPEPEHVESAIYDPALAPATLVLVPGLAFTERGARLGRGKGYYDRFLSSPGMEECIRMGVCWSLQIDASVPIEAHDVLMDWICHESYGLRTRAR